MRSVPAERLLPPIALAGALLIGVGYLVVSGVELSTYAALEFAQIWRLALVCAVLLVSFLAFGLIIALIFTSRSERIHTLYGADLAGAGVGCAAAVPLPMSRAIIYRLRERVTNVVGIPMARGVPLGACTGPKGPKNVLSREVL